ncbi:mitochondrial 2-oxodicarboxylate carrier protein-like protein [Setomelanomma holmii]|uniref:Mitochondrial 2-oxodicarboxylate carrier protein-like protein n=1 Tax=Setomelanomma holmii TaxID=210430 RepID=A0A9P4H5W5_9PLEO|nr:mitochondrial 2-oxodicarboxylate carrier protein-like protein [Setomelanomma holmii]
MTSKSSSEKVTALPFRYQFAAGAVAGISEVVERYPLDVVKTHIQLQHGVMSGNDGYSGVLDCFRKIIRHEGISRLYRGTTAPILMEVPKRLTDFFGPIYQRIFATHTMNQPLAVLTGASAGATDSFVVVPFELLKIRLQDKSSAARYNGLTECLLKVARHEGPLALYNGLEATLWRHIVRAQMPDPTRSPNLFRQKTLNDLAASFVGGVFGTTLDTPLDVVKSRIQSVAKVAGAKQKYEWAWPSLAVVAREEGFRALYKGYLAKVLRFGPDDGVLVLVYSAVLDLLASVA